MNRISFSFFLIAISISFNLKAQTLPENYYERLNKCCKNANILKRLGFFTGRLLINFVVEDKYFTFYRIQQSVDLGELSEDIKFDALPWKDQSHWNKGESKFDMEIVQWEENLQLGYPNKDFRYYRVSDLDLNKSLIDTINQQISCLVRDYTKYYEESVALLNEAIEFGDNRHRIEKSFQERYKDHFEFLEVEIGYFRIRYNIIEFKIRSFQDDLLELEKVYVHQLEEKRRLEQEEESRREEERKKKEIEKRKLKSDRIANYRDNSFFELPFSVKKTHIKKECKYCGEECNITNPFVQRPDCQGNQTCDDLWYEYASNNVAVASYLVSSMMGTLFDTCNSRNCKELYKSPHVWRTIDKSESVEYWIYTPKGIRRK